MYIHRHAEKAIKEALQNYKVVLVTGPRQVGKTTLLQNILNDEYRYETLDFPQTLKEVVEDPVLFFKNRPGKLMIDEVQRAPEMFSVIKYFVDQSEERGQIVLTSSQVFPLMKNVSDSLAGRVGIVRLNGLSLRERVNERFYDAFVPTDTFLNKKRESLEVKKNLNIWDLIHTGDMPIVNRPDGMSAKKHYSDYISTYIERDARAVQEIRNVHTFSNFMIALAARTSQEINYHQLAKEVQVDSTTIQNWVTILETTGIIVRIQPYSNNQLKRVIKSPRVYFMDTGLVAHLTAWPTSETLARGQMAGPMLETFVVSEILKSYHNKGERPLLYFYRDKDQKEIDLIIREGDQLYPIEIKKSSMPDKRMTKHFSVLDKVDSFNVGNKLILSLIDEKRYLTHDLKTIAYPILDI